MSIIRFIVGFIITGLLFSNAFADFEDVERLRKILNYNVDQDLQLEFLKIIEGKRYLEISEEAELLLFLHADEKDKKRQNIELMYQTIIVLGKSLNRDAESHFYSLQTEILSQFSSTSPEYKRLSDAFERSFLEINDTSSEIPLLKNSPPNRIPKLDRQHMKKVELLARSKPSIGSDANRMYAMTIQDYAKEAKDKLSKWIIGQPELVNNIVKIEVKNRAKGYMSRKKPVISYLIGAPGNGKDTAAKAHVNFIHDRMDAYEEHFFETPRLQTKSDLAQLFGSPPGYVNSDNFPEFFDRLIKHSGGKYKKVEMKKPNGEIIYKVELNDKFKGECLDDYFPPETMVVYLNEFHDWSKFAKNEIKDFLEYGRVHIKNPNGGLTTIAVPVTIYIASNEGIHLTTAREISGKRFGKPLTYEESLSLWEQNYKNKTLLKDTLMQYNSALGNNDSETAKGTSEEIISRIPATRIFLMRPLSPGSLQQIIRFKLHQLQMEYFESHTEFSRLKFTFTNKLVKFIQEYNFNAEENARPLDDKIGILVEETINMAFVKKIIVAQEGLKINIDVEQREDKSWELVFNYKYKNLETDELITKKAQLLIEPTLYDIPPMPISSEEIENLLGLENRLKEKIFGIDKIAQKIAKAVLLAEEGRVGGANTKDKARSYGLFGLSGTGKTETAKVLAESLYGSSKKLVILEMGRIKSVDDLKTVITGHKDPRGLVIPSEFMKHFDKHQGRFIVVLDELSNAPQEVQTELYNFLDEPVVEFVDGNARSMANVTFIITGNTGEEWYNGIPDWLSDDLRRKAFQDVFEFSLENPNFVRSTLEQKFKPAFLNRLNGAFFYPPLDFKAARQIADLKMKLLMDKFKASESKRGWNLLFENVESYNRLLNFIESESFDTDKQGRSIDDYVNGEVYEKIRLALLENDVESNTDILISVGEVISSDSNGEKNRQNFKEITLVLESGREIHVILEGKLHHDNPVTSWKDQVKTSFHEAGHEIVRKVYLEDYFESKFISRIPGVMEFNGALIVYAGVASSKDIKRPTLNYEYIIREMAVLSGGFVGEQLITQGWSDAGGKSNDMERANSLAEQAILINGLSKEWGNRTVPTGMTIKTYKENSLTQDDLKLLNTIKAKMRLEAEELARYALLRNRETYLKMGHELAIKGKLTRPELDQIYTETNVITDKEEAFKKRWTTYVGGALAARLAKYKKVNSISPKFTSDMTLQKDEVFSFEKYVNDEKQKAYASIPDCQHYFIKEN